MKAVKALRELVRFWNGSLGWDAFAEVEAGLRRERERLATKRSLLVVFREAVQFGAPSERFDLIQDPTVDLGDAEVVALARAHVERWKRPGWTLEPCAEKELDALRHSRDDITRVGYAGFRAASPWGGKEWVTIHVENLKVWTDVTFGDALLSYLSREDALVAYLRDRGHRPLATSASRESSNAPCPRCWGELVGRNVGLKQIWPCRRCGGVWLPPDAARTIMQHEDGSLRLVLASEKAARIAREATENALRNTCPWDGQPLHETTVDGVLVESCAAHGTWFDAHEVHHIANAHTHDKPAPDLSKWGPGGVRVGPVGGSDSRSDDVFDAVWDLIFRR